jgi:hypothetical protein
LFALFGLFFGRTIEPVETMYWSWRQAVRWTGGVDGKLVVGLLVVLSVGLIFGLAFGQAFGLIFGLVGGLVTSLVSVIDSGLVPGKVGQKLVPNQAIWASLRNGLICIAIGLIFGLVFGLFVGTDRGAGAFIRHFVLRARLAFEGFAPFRYVAFLEYATTLLFLERNGGAYRFRHDLLQEYFASLT